MTNSNGVSFDSLAAAEGFAAKNQPLIAAALRDVDATEGVVWSDVWLNGNGPSFVEGYNADDQPIVAVKL